MDDNKQKKIIEEIINGSGNDLRVDMNNLHPAEISDIIEQLPEDKRKNIWHLINSNLKGEIFLKVHGDVKKHLIHITSEKELVEATINLQLDEIADLDEDLPPKVINAVIQQMDIQKLNAYDSLKEYPDDTAGGLMDVDALSIRSDITIGVAIRFIRFLRRKYKELPEHLDSLYVIDIANNFIGTVGIVELVSQPANTKISKVVNRGTKTISDTLPASKVARLFEYYDLISAPVVDSSNKLLGRITIDDVVDVIRKEGDKLTMRPVGLSEKTDTFGAITKTVRLRAIWHGINLINAFIAAFTISLFSDSIDKIVSLAILMPIIASMGGVAGNQTLTLVTRGLALDQINKDNKSALLNREIIIGFINGLIWAIIVAIITFIWMQNYLLSLVFSTSLLLSLLLSATAGTFIPLFLKKLNIDPALAGSVILVAVSDVAGFFIFLSLATIFLI